jgi:XTP/dITP diphosphohydrolase
MLPPAPPLEVVVATRNPHKLEEIRAILAGLPVRLLSAADLGAPEVEEDEPTLEGNAAKKAQVVADATGRVALADDTGLEVDALGGRPGVHSARYAGPDATYADNRARLLEELAGTPPEGRGARFRCVIHLARPGVSAAAREGLAARGAIEGAIALAPRGSGGFGYDPVFLVAGDPAGRTLAELSPEEKNAISHRGRALASLRDALAGFLERRADAVRAAL